MEFLSDVVTESGQSLQSSTNGPCLSADLTVNGNSFLPNGDLTDSVVHTLRDTYAVLVSETHSDRFEPAYVQINVTAEPKSLRIWLYLSEDASLSLRKPLDSSEEECLDLLDKTVFGNEEGTLRDVSFTTEDIKGISLTKKNNRAVYLYTVHYSQDYCLSFSCESTKHQFYMVVRDSLFSADEPAGFLLDDDPQEIVRFEYEVDDNGQRIVLGKGSFGTVYSGRELTREVKIAIKALNNINSSFPLFLLRKYGALKEEIVASYSMQILEGLKYLDHDNRIIHRDIKADNVLVNMYNGDIKITDFGTSKRLIGLDPRACTVAGTMRYMAPELVVGRRGYGYPVDIWSFGCTVVEMLTATVPFVELENAFAAFYTIGRDKKHPTIPSTVSTLCHNFLMRTFDSNPDARATAGQLLVDEFIETGSVDFHHCLGGTDDHSHKRANCVPGYRVQIESDEDEHDKTNDEREIVDADRRQRRWRLGTEQTPCTRLSQGSLNQTVQETSTYSSSSTMHADSKFSLMDQLRQHFLSLFGCCSNPIPATYGHSASPRRQPQRAGSGLFKRFLSLAPSEISTLQSQDTTNTHAPSSACETGHFVLPSEVDVGQILGNPVSLPAEMEDVPVRTSVLHGNSEPSVPAAVDQNSFIPGKILKPKRSNGEEPAISTRVRERLAASGELLPTLHLRDRPPVLNGFKLSDSGSLLNRSSSSGPTPTTASFGASADTFGFLKQDSEARHLLTIALRSQKKTVLTNWHYLVSRQSGVHLPVLQSSASPSTGVGFKSPPPVSVFSPTPETKSIVAKTATENTTALSVSDTKTPNQHMSHCTNLGDTSNATGTAEVSVAPLTTRDAFEFELLECLLDMLLDHLEGGTTWSNMTQYLISPTSITQPITCQGLVSKNSSSDIATRFDSLLRRLIEQLQGGLPGTVSLPNSPLLVEFLHTAFLMMWTAFDKPLHTQLNRPHELLAWHKLISDAVALAVHNLAVLDECGDIRHPGPDGLIPEGRLVTLRRNRTFAARAGGPAAHVRDEMNRRALTHSQDQFEASPPMRPRIRPLSMAYHSNDRQRTLSFEMNQPDSTTGISVSGVSGPGITSDLDTAARRRASFARNSERSSLYRRSTGNFGPSPLTEELNEDETSLRTVNVDPGSTLFGTTAHLRTCPRYTNLHNQIDEEREETEKLNGELIRLSIQHNQLLTSMIQQRHSEVDYLRALAPEAVTYNQDLVTGYSNLQEWFASLNLSGSDLEKLYSQGITDEEDFLKTVTKEDLWRLNLSGGAVLRIWRKLSKLRQAASVTIASQL
ncbi:Mitogen-activated protein kinase kinase kinase 15 [Fasciola gigantica]|uniref:Mitogen-activated protein kinase kinase kinase 15 n=1 Tax=Fasciola gigantica TaxID=46835 RepID=A0A504YU95_FASGI|nr:Mitogen-activated protein kinase kinase kinase 15 [Fasciola gigantica]